MVDVNEIYGSGSRAFLNTEIAEKEQLFDKVLTIKTSEVREIRDRQKIVIDFMEIDYALPLNRTNAMILAEAFGSNSESWHGKKIKLKKVKRTFQGRLIDAIEVEPVKKSK